MEMTAAVLCQSACILGEGPIWFPDENKLMWVDIEQCKLYALDWQSRATHFWQLEKRVTVILPVADDPNNLLLGMQGGLAKFDPVNNRFQWLANIEKELATHRCNDGACDPQGRLWVGTLCTDFITGSGSLYMLDDGLSLSKKIGGLTIPNGICWSADQQRMYFIDSTLRTVQSFLFDAATGRITFEKIAVEIPPSLGSPDGMAIDEEGMLWVAHYGGFGVYRWNPHTSALLDKIELPVPNVTSCVFGGPHLDTLFITTARQELSDETLQRYPDSGHVFYAQVPVRGLPANPCRVKASAGFPNHAVYVPKQAFSAPVP